MKVTDLQESFLAAAENTDNALITATTASHVSDALSPQKGALAHLYVMTATLGSEHVYRL